MDLPALVEELVLRNGSHFVDATDALQAALGSQLPYSAILDTHVNALGSRVIAEVLSSALARADVGTRDEALEGDRLPDGEAHP